MRLEVLAEQLIELSEELDNDFLFAQRARDLIFEFKSESMDLDDSAQGELDE
jgi:hypothetical protein